MLYTGRMRLSVYDLLSETALNLPVYLYYCMCFMCKMPVMGMICYILFQFKEVQGTALIFLRQGLI